MLIRVRVKAGARKETVIELGDHQLQIAVKERPENNAANRRVIELVAEHYRSAVRYVHITRGHFSTTKTLEIDE